MGEDRIFVGRVSTPDGGFSILGDDVAVLGSGWTTPDVLLAMIGASGAVMSGEPGSLVARAVSAVEGYYAGEPDLIRGIPVRQVAGEFHTRARAVLRETGCGERLTYTQLAARTGNPRAARAAASACARNATALFVPCHRVVRTDGGLGGFLYGLKVKESLLEYEHGFVL